MSEPEIKVAPYPATVIRKVEEFVLNNVGKVAVLTAIKPEEAEMAKQPVTIYQGFAVLGARLSSGQIMQIPVEFDIEATGIEDAFGKFQEGATKQMHLQMEQARAQHEAEQRRIVTANGSLPPPPGGIQLK